MQRREVVEQQPGFKRTYDQVVRNQAKKRNTQDAQPYNKSKHNEALLNPRGRSPPYKEMKNPRTQVEPINTTRHTTYTPLTQQTLPTSADHRQQNRTFSTKEDILKYFKEVPNDTIQLIVKTLMSIIINSQEIQDEYFTRISKKMSVSKTKITVFMKNKEVGNVGMPNYYIRFIVRSTITQYKINEP